ncbi:PHP domain-containing protein [Candidatus Woesearchaeota archaeon]|nr:MAG: PHP domain-containing protein [Candidatus Woesearchaeota archaeon]
MGRMTKKTGKGKTITFQLHCHTDASHDSESKIEEIIGECEKRGIDAIAITDHNVPFDMKRIKGIKTNVKVVPGIEVNSEDDSDIIGLFITKPIKARKNIEIVREIHKQGGIAVLPHPFRRYQGYLSPLKKRSRKEVEEMLSEIDAVEIYNGKCSPEENRKAKEFFRSRGIPVLGGSDAHTPREIKNILNIFKISSNFKTDKGDAGMRKAILEAERDIIVHPAYKYLTLTEYRMRRTLKKAAQKAGIRKNSRIYRKGRKFVIESAKKFRKVAGVK